MYVCAARSQPGLNKRYINCNVGKRRQSLNVRKMRHTCGVLTRSRLRRVAESNAAARCSVRKSSTPGTKEDQQHDQGTRPSLSRTGVPLAPMVSVTS
jgi:hypothetical protein